MEVEEDVIDKIGIFKEITEGVLTEAEAIQLMKTFRNSILVKHEGAVENDV